MLIVVLTGAGISAESGLKTFRNMGGLWENHSIEDVATPEAWKKNPQLVLDFYNQRRSQAHDALPNAGHIALAQLQEKAEVIIITQNVDGLHEKAGSKQVLHLHGELSKVRSEANKELIYEIGGEHIELGQKAEDGNQLRPHIVWFGEEVPMMEAAMNICQDADAFLVVGTSLAVYPAAGLVNFVPSDCPKFIIDPGLDDYPFDIKNTVFIKEKASIGVPKAIDQIFLK
ncbi:MAG: SIR2 family NAD-dependent protein deacylase [Leadbetterella sp.]